MRIYLARHGQTRWNVERRMQGWGNSDLTLEGHEQARCHGKLLKREGVSKIYASDLGRVQQTLECIHEHCDVATEVNEELRECSMGDWEGKLVDELRSEAEYDRWRVGGDAVAPPNGESMLDVKRRVDNVLKSIRQEPYNSVALVTHGLTTRVLLDLLVELTEDQKLSLRIPNNVVHMVDLGASNSPVVHFRDGGASAPGICTSVA